MKTSRIFGLAVLGLALASAGLLPARGEALTEAKARSLTASFYSALMAESAQEVRPRLEAATSADWKSCATNDLCETRDEVIARWSRRHDTVPNLRFEVKELIVAGEKIIVRGESRGTPSGDFLGVPRSGRSFRILVLDIHTTRDGRLVNTYHVEDWAGAARQLRGQ